MQSPELAPELGRGSPRADSTKLSPCAHLPRSTMRPSLSTRIWSAPTTVESLQRKAGCYSRSEGRGSGGVCTVQGATSTGAVTSEQEDRSVCPSWGAGQLRELSTSRINPFPSSLPMCNNDGGAVGADFGQGSLDVPFCLRVECRCRLRERQGMRKGCRQHGQLLGQGGAAEQGKARLGAAAITSSSRMMRGPFRMVRAMATRCFSPPLNFSPRSPTWVLYPAGTRAGTCCAGALQDGDGNQGSAAWGGPAGTTQLPGTASAHPCPGI